MSHNITNDIKHKVQLFLKNEREISSDGGGYCKLNFLQKIIPCLLLGFFFLIAYINYNLIGDDIVFFKDYLCNAQEIGLDCQENIFGALNFRYNGWTSREIIEALQFFFTNHLMIFKITTTILVIALPLVISNVLYNKSNTHRKFKVVVLSCLLFPLFCASMFDGTGLVTTTVGQFYPCFFFLFSVIMVRKIFNKEKIKRWEYIFYFISLAFATNQEQVSVMSVLLFVSCIIINIIRERKVVFGFIVGAVISILSLIFHMTCPGNKVRSIDEQEHWFKNFSEIPFLHKLELGFSSTIVQLINSPVFLVFTILLAYLVFTKTAKLIPRILSGFLIVIAVVFCGLFEPVLQDTVFGKIHMNIKNYIPTTEPIPQTSFVTHLTKSNLLIPLLFIIILFIIFYLIWCVFGRSYITLVVAGIITLGLISRFIMALSPTIWASGIRTFFPLYLSFIIVICYSKTLKTAPS